MRIGTIINNQFAVEGNPTKYFIYTGIVGEFATGICFIDGKIEKMQFDKTGLNSYLEPIGYCKAFEIIEEDLRLIGKGVNEKEIYRQALNKWKDKQMVMVFEEMAELQKELCKSLRGKENRIEIAEEIADVEIMLEQMKLYYGIEEGVKRYKELKLQRLGKRLVEGG